MKYLATFLMVLILGCSSGDPQTSPLADENGCQCSPGEQGPPGAPGPAGQTGSVGLPAAEQGTRLKLYHYSSPDGLSYRSTLEPIFDSLLDFDCWPFQSAQTGWRCVPKPSNALEYADAARTVPVIVGALNCDVGPYAPKYTAAYAGACFEILAYYETLGEISQPPKLYKKGYGYPCVETVVQNGLKYFAAQEVPETIFAPMSVDTD